MGNGVTRRIISTCGGRTRSEVFEPSDLHSDWRTGIREFSRLDYERYGRCHVRETVISTARAIFRSNVLTAIPSGALARVSLNEYNEFKGWRIRRECAE